MQDHEEADIMAMMEMPSPWRALAERVVTEYRVALGDNLLAAACFGSVARGRPDPDSDLDLYVVTCEEGIGPLNPRLGTLCLRDTSEYQVLAREGYRPDPMPIFHTAAKLASHPWILLDIADHGVILYDPEGVLARELAAVRRRLRELGSQRIDRPDGTWYWDLKPDWRPGQIVAL